MDMGRPTCGRTVRRGSGVAGVELAGRPQRVIQYAMPIGDGWRGSMYSFIAHHPHGTTLIMA